MADTIREQIIAAIATALANVRTAKGFNTECGQNVVRAAKQLDPDDLPAIVIWPGHETVSKEYSVNTCLMPLRVEGLKAFGSSNISTVAETILGDLIELMTAIIWTRTYTSGGTYQILAGNTITGATSGATAYVEAVSLDTGTWAGGDAAGTLTLRRVVGTFEAENLNVGANSNVATIAGGLTGQRSEAVVASGLADGIKYVSGGVEEYPEPEQIDVGVPVVFEITYRTVAGDPYHQPS